VSWRHSGRYQETLTARARKLLAHGHFPTWLSGGQKSRRTNQTFFWFSTEYLPTVFASVSIGLGVGRTNYNLEGQVSQL